MPNIGDRIHSRDLGFKGTLSWYIWAQCIDCGKQSWVRAFGIKDKPWVCADCSHRKSHLSKVTLQISQTGLRECTNCHKVYPATLEYFSKNKKVMVGIVAKCRVCEQKLRIEKRNKLGKIESTCPVCGKVRLVWNTSKARADRICHVCALNISGKLKLPRGNYNIIYKPKVESHCKVCGGVYPATLQYFRPNKKTKNGLNLSICRKCHNKIRHRNRMLTIEGRIGNRISNYIRQTLNGTKCYRHWETLVGYSAGDLIKHLQKQFTDGMSWDNYGTWHIDHVIPQSAFHYTTPDDIDFKRCWALSNLQPLWRWENESKGAQILRPFQPSLKLENRKTKGGIKVKGY